MLHECVRGGACVLCVSCESTLRMCRVQVCGGRGGPWHCRMSRGILVTAGLRDEMSRGAKGASPEQGGSAPLPAAFPTGQRWEGPRCHPPACQGGVGPSSRVLPTAPGLGWPPDDGAREAQGGAAVELAVGHEGFQMEARPRVPMDKRMLGSSVCPALLTRAGGCDNDVNAAAGGAGG